MNTWSVAIGNLSAPVVAPTVSVEEDGERICRHCGEEKPLREFYVKQVNGTPYRLPTCAKCIYQRAKFRRENPAALKGTETEKRCQKCDVVKPVAEFRQSPHTRRDGTRAYRNLCRKCERKRNAGY